jgi:hypothetical protein
MLPVQRREFLADVGRGMFVAGLGSGLAFDLGLSPAVAAEAPKRLTFDKLEPLVSMMQETPVARILPALLAKLREGTDLRTLTAAGALANVRTFGGQDYVGFHTFMALPPALDMAGELPDDRKALPVLKVLFRNAQRIQGVGGSKNEVLHTLRTAVRKPDMGGAERQFATLMTRGTQDAYDALQHTIQDEVDVHRVVLCWRSWMMIDIAGKDYSHALLRQSVRYCVDTETRRLGQKYPASGIRELLPKLLDEHKLAGKALGSKRPDDAWVERLAEVIYGAGRDRAAEAVAMALAEGFSADAVGEAMSMAANLLVLRDPGRTKDEDGKPKGSVHGASVGVHASDSANAWRGIARVSNARNTFASLIVGAYHTAGQSGGQSKETQPLADALAKVTATDPAALLGLTEAAITSRDQALASALASRYGDAGHSEKPLYDLLLKYAISEDGALHAEKYYRTVREEFASSRPAFRWRQMTALARVTASEYGYPAPGYDEAKRLLKL